MAVALSLNNPIPFNYDDETKLTAGVRWPRWLREFETFVDASGIADAKQKKAVFLHTVGPAAREIYYAVEATDDDYAKIVAALDKHFKALVNVDYEIFAFGKVMQRESESMSDYVTRLRNAAKDCNFKTALDAELEKQILAGCKSDKMREHILMTKEITVTAILEKAKAGAEAAIQAKAFATDSSRETFIKREPGTAAMNKMTFKRDDKRSTSGRSQKSTSRPFQKSTSKSGVLCFACGYDYPHRGDCPAKGEKCRVCQEIGHFASSKFCKKEKGHNRWNSSER